MKLNKNIKPQGLGKNEPGRIYRELKGNDNGILYYEDTKVNLVVRQALPQKYDVDLAKKIRKNFLSKVWCKKIVAGIYTTADKVCGEEPDEKVFKDIEKGAGGQNGQMSVLIFNSQFSVPICAADIITAVNNHGMDFENGAIQFSFLPGVTDNNQHMVKKWLKNC